MSQVYDRATGKIIEQPQYGGNSLRFLYQNPFGRIFLRLANSHLVSEINARKNRNPKSKAKIQPFIDRYHIKTDHSASDFSSFADFFCRQEQRGVDNAAHSLVAPADSKLLCYKIDGQRIKIKQSEYQIEDLVNEKIDEFKDGYCLVFRLAMDDYHRYCYIDDGELAKQVHIKGRLHTVSSISDQYRIYAQNDRVVNYLETKHLGKIIQIEVGALLVGRIQNHPTKTFKKGDEKGYFELGGSTIVLLLPKNVTIEGDIIKHSRQGIETKVNYGERIGTIC